MADIRAMADQVRSMGRDLGFSFVGFARAGLLDEEARRLDKWLNAGYHGKMGYMENHFEKRIDPTKLVPGARTVICLMYNYYTEREQEDPESPKLSKYAYGQDYHKVIKEKLHRLLDQMRTRFGDIQGRCFVDSAPVMERDWARYAGLGWTGKNTLLIHPRAGSYFFLAELIIDLDLEPDRPMRDYCGTCTRCIDACPTEAISSQGYLVDGSKCISYLTIELREEIPELFSGKMDNWMFGCDVCQEVCPWNRFSKKHDEPAFEPPDQLMTMQKRDWIEITEEVFNALFKNSAVKRTKYQGLKRNIKFLQ